MDEQKPMTVEDLLKLLEQADQRDREEIASLLGPFMRADARSASLRDAKQYVNTRYLINGTEVTTDHAGNTVGLTGGKGQFDIVNFQGGTARINSASNARQIDITAGGAGADCLFDYLVSSCWTTTVAAGLGVEGQSILTASGCTFKMYSTWTGAVGNFSAGGNYVVAICAGSYSENVVVPSNITSCRIYGSGVDRVTLTASSAASPTLTLPASVGLEISAMTLVGNAANTVLSKGAGRGYFQDLLIKPKAGGIGFFDQGDTEVVNVKIDGASTSATGLNFTVSGGTPSAVRYSNVYITACATGIVATSGCELHMDNIRIESATTGISFSSGGCKDSSWSNIYFKTCTTAIGGSCGGGDYTTWANLVFKNCNIGIDLTGFNLVASCTGMNGALFANLVFDTATPAFIGVKASGGTAATRECEFRLMHFIGYTSGNEISGTSDFGTNTKCYHNNSDAGTLSDYGTVVGHTAGGVGTAAPASSAFVTIGNDANLSAERALTAGSGVGVTDAGANSTVTLALANLTGNWTQAGVFDISTAGNLIVLKHMAVGANAGGIDANTILTFAETFTDPASPIAGIQGSPTKTMTSANAIDVIGAAGNASVSGAFADTGIVAGVSSTVKRLTNNAGSTSADFRNYDALANFFAAASATLTARYGFYARDMTGNGTLTTQYGFYVPALAKGGTNWAFYSVSAPSFFGGAITRGPVSAPSTPAATNLVEYNETGTQFLKVKDASGNVYNETHLHLLPAQVDVTVASTTVPYQVVGPMPQAGVITNVYAKLGENKTNGATSSIFDIHLITAANQDTDGQGTTVYTTQGNRPTIANTHMATTATAPDVTSFAAGDWFAIYTDQAGTTATVATVSIALRYT